MAMEYKIRNVCAPAVGYGEQATVSGQLVRKADGTPVAGVEVEVQLKSSTGDLPTQTPITDKSGNFTAIFAASSLNVGTYSGILSVEDAKRKPVTLKVYEVPSTASCDPCTDMITAAKRVLRDPKVNRELGNLILGYAKQEGGSKKDLGLLKEAALGSLAKAVSGKDAVRAKGEPCRGQCRLYFEFLEPINALPGTAPAANEITKAIEVVQKQIENSLNFNGSQRDTRRTQLHQDILKTINFQLLDGQLRIAGEGSRTFDAQGGILISDVEAGIVYVSLLADLFGGAEIIDDFLATNPGDNTFTRYRRTTPTILLPATGATSTQTLQLNYTVEQLTASDAYQVQLSASGGTAPYAYTIVGTPPDGVGKLDPLTNSISVELNAQEPIKFKVQVTDSAVPPNKKEIKCIVDPTDIKANNSLNTQTNASLTPQDKVSGTAPSPAAGLSLTVGGGLETRAVFFIRPAAAQVRCFSFMEGDDCCGQGRQYISKVAIRAAQGDNVIQCMQTSDSGCSGFHLNPGWYNFSASQEITVGGCNYMLSSSSPVSAFLGVGQSCSDIYFSYKKKGNEIQVISEISSALGGDPYKEAKVNFPGMQYLLLREDDVTFAQQQTTSNGGAVVFRNLTAGTYLLFCQAPATYGSQPVTPVFPAEGRMTLRVFGGQTSRIPVLVKFRTTTVAPAVLDGYVRDNYGQPVPQQLVQVLDNANRLMAAGLTDSNGFYSIQVYKAEDLTVLVGAQQYTVAKTQIQASMEAVGTPALPSPDSTFDLAMQTSELARY